MTSLDIKSWSQKQQVIAVMLIAGLFVFLLCNFLLLPQSRKRKTIEREIRNMRSQLQQSNYLIGETALVQKAVDEQKKSNMLLDEWQDVMAHLTARDSGVESADVRPRLIDFKTELYAVEQRLLKKARETGIRLPASLGVEESVETNEDARELMHQLRAVERLINLSLDLDILGVLLVEPLPILRHGGGPENAIFFEEYPVHIRFQGTLHNLYDLLHASLERGTTFALRNVRVEAASAFNKELLHIDAVMSSMVFTRSPSDITPVQKRKILVQPKGF